MKTIQASIIIDAERKATISFPDIVPGEYRALILLDPGGPAQVIPPDDLSDFPVIDIGPWPEGLSLRREGMYGDDGLGP
jgi:hypothetical protein